MVVGVDQPRQYNMTGKVEYFIGFAGEFARWTNIFDKTVPHKEATIRNFPAAVIHGDQYGGMLYQKCRHKEEV
jgi:hypothetical protein